MRPVDPIILSTLCMLLLASCGSESTPKPTTIDTHSSRDSLDWAGTYRGTIPCADCEGIETSVTLSYDGSYFRRVTYLGKSGRAFTDEGTFVWDENGAKVTLIAEDGTTQIYQVGENVLIHLDRDGRPITGDLSERYRLWKHQN